MAGEGGGTSRSLQDTPTWALATVCFFFIFLGLFIEQLIHLTGHWLKKKRKKALFEAVEKLKSVLMLLGFMSLILAVTQKSIAKICIPTRIADSMLPCRKVAETKTTKAIGTDAVWINTFQDFVPRPERGLAAEASTSSSDHCGSKGMTSLISQGGINQLNTFIFVLAIMQIVYSAATMGLGKAKMKSWKAWEKETQTVEYQAANDPERFRYTRQTTFARRHTSSCSTTSSQLLWIKCFFRQFFNSVDKVDYLTLRHGFISAHLSTNNTFDFRKYIQRSLEDDFKVVVGISPMMWLMVVILLLVDVHGWHVYLWISFLPLAIVLVLGTKLETIVARMALKLQDQNSVIKGAPLVQPNDKLFWFSHPDFVLTLLHYTLFMNAFELAFIIWVTFQFGFNSCFHENAQFITIRVLLAVMVQVICSYITLPLYALVTQMGSHFKSAVLEEQTKNVIKQWHVGVREKRKKRPYNNSQSPQHDNSPSVWSINTKTPSPELSSHHRMPTLAEFESRSRARSTNEIVEEVQWPEISQAEPSTSSVTLTPIDHQGVQIEIPEITENHT